MTDAQQWLELTEKLERIRDGLQDVQWALQKRLAEKRAEQVITANPHRGTVNLVPRSHLEGKDED